MQELRDIVAARVALAGVTRRQLEAACSAVPQVGWERLPLYTDLTIEGLPLQTYLKVRCPLDLETFISVYEEFVAGFLLTRELASTSATLWLTKHLMLLPLDATRLFSDGVRRRGRRHRSPRHLVQAVVSVAAIAEYNYGAQIVKSDATQFVVETQLDSTPIQFGMIDGRPVTNLGKQRLGTRVSPVRHRSGLVHSGRRRVVELEHSHASLYSELAAFNKWRPNVLSESSEGFKLALSLVRHAARRRVPRQLADVVPNGSDPAAFRQAVRLASGFENFGTPYSEIRQLLVPTFVKPDEFHELFGNAPRAGLLTHQRAQQWKLALDYLSERLKEEA